MGVYARELANGKFWGIEHDLRVVRGHGLAVAGEAPFLGRFDHVFATTASLSLHGASPPLPEERLARLLQGEDMLPNAEYPSDHLPVAVAFEWRAS